MTLPIAGEVRAGLLLHRKAGEALNMLAVGHAAVILAPRGFLRVAEKILAGDAVMMADLSATQAREIGLGVVRAGAVRAVSLLMVDPAHFEASVQRIP